MADNKSINIIIPIFNEEGSLEHLFSEVKKSLNNASVNWYVTFVDDGSKDDSLKVAHKLSKKHAGKIKTLSLSRNFGKEIALTAGLHSNQADAVVMMDADLQHPPKYIPKFIELWEKGAQVVVGVRTKEAKDSKVKEVSSSVFYKVMNSVSEIRLKPKSTDFRLLDKAVVDAFNTMEENNRITRGMIDWLGFERKYVEFAAEERLTGQASYSFRKLLKLATDSFVSMSLFPLRVSIYLGFVTTLFFGILGIIILISKYLLDNRFDFSGPAALATVIAFLVGIILINIGFVGMYIANIHQQVKGRPLYVINKRNSIE